MPPNFPRSIYGVDFSGAKLAGRTIWVARLDPTRRPMPLISLDRLENLCGTAEREASLAYLVRLIQSSDDALWAIDFPFSLPVELLDPRTGWKHLLDFAGAFPQTGHHFGHWCLARAKQLGGRNHLLRHTDAELKAPFSCYHYRIAYQTFHGLRDVLLPLSRDRLTCALPFQPARLATARRILVEACPSSTLKLLGLPHQNYKQPAGGPLTAKRRRTRHAILETLRTHATLADRHVRAIMRDGGGDALDALIAAIGAAHAWRSLDHAAVAKNPRRRREGFIYAGAPPTDSFCK